MSILTGLRIRWPPAVPRVVAANESPSLTATLTSVTHALAGADVCVEAFVGNGSVTPDGMSAIVCLPTNLPVAIAALRQLDLQVEEVPLVIAWLPDTMISVACACEALQTAEVRIEIVCLIRVDRGHGQQVAFLCDNAELADRLLWALCY